MRTGKLRCAEAKLLAPAALAWPCTTSRVTVTDAERRISVKLISSPMTAAGAAARSVRHARNAVSRHLPASLGQWSPPMELER
jgi:hypothetical protein